MNYAERQQHQHQLPCKPPPCKTTYPLQNAAHLSEVHNSSQPTAASHLQQVPRQASQPLQFQQRVKCRKLPASESGRVCHLPPQCSKAATSPSASATAHATTPHFHTLLTAHLCEVHNSSQATAASPPPAGAPPGQSQSRQSWHARPQLLTAAARPYSAVSSWPEPARGYDGCTVD